MKKKQQIKIKPKKFKANSDEWLSTVKNIVNARKKDFTFWKRIMSAIKRDTKDTEKELCKEVINRLDNKKVPLEEAQQMAISSANVLQELRQRLPKVLIYFLGGGIMLLCSIIFLAIRIPKVMEPGVWIKDQNFIFWSVMIIIHGVVFYIGLQKRKVFEDELITNSVLSQACAAYAAARAPGRGGSLFEAYNYLEMIRQKNKSAFDNKVGFGKKKT